MQRLKDQDVNHKFKDDLINLLEKEANLILESLEDKWFEVFCGLSKNGKLGMQTWWWDSSVDGAVKEKEDHIIYGKMVIARMTMCN